MAGVSPAIVILRGCDGGCGSNSDTHGTT